MQTIYSVNGIIGWCEAQWITAAQVGVPTSCKQVSYTAGPEQPDYLTSLPKSAYLLRYYLKNITLVK